uniref:Uncharacterized protein n=1 Tax=Capra hircus TaxID=9925 RepID=A0A8C2P0Z9_CAPHI
MALFPAFAGVAEAPDGGRKVKEIMLPRLPDVTVFGLRTSRL